MRVVETALPGVVLIQPDVYEDLRGYFLESWRLSRYREQGLPSVFVQDNLSFSRKGVLRGLHFQHPQGQGKLVSVLRGEIFDVAVDIRVGSPTCGQWTGVVLSDENKQQLYLPEGFAHGFCVTGDEALVLYKCTAYYNPLMETTLVWNDPDIGITWPESSPILSDKDKNGFRLGAISPERLPVFEG